ncbi:MAG: DUF4215 domain-containing protein [Myxococcales bacterium]|nr:DUF4215 domain-containing protein [Myxococcales bacterium]
MNYRIRACAPLTVLLALAACTADDTSGESEATSASAATNAATSSATTNASMSGSTSDASGSGTMDASSGTTGDTGASTGSGTTGTGASASEPTTSMSTTAPMGCNNDGSIDPGEQCDDGNLEGGDGCENDCTYSPPGNCGDGIVDWDEECDDGNDVPGDGCENCMEKSPACPNEDTAIKCDSDTMDPFKAIELNCSANPEETPVLMNNSMHSNNASAWRVAKGFGSYMEMGKLLYSPRGGESFLMVSTGVIKAPNAQGVVVETPSSQESNGDNGNDDSDTLPPPINVSKGSNNGGGGMPFMNCDGVGDCSDSLYDAWELGTGDPNDKLWFTFQTKVPNAVESYSFNFAYFSSEWPDWVDTTFNDLLIAWQTSEAYTGNVTFIGDAPLTVTSLDPYLSTDGYSGNEPQLQGTGFEGNAGSDWFAANQNVVGGETLTMTFMIADMGDSILATMAIIDNFHWNCEACIPANAPECQGEVPDPNCCGVIEPQ